MSSSLSSVIVVGIDFGTTYSGVSWAVNEGRKNVKLITDWSNPSASIANADKVPSIISYKNGSAENWGYEVGLKEEAFRWFKILLEPESKYAQTTKEVRHSNELLKKVNKSAQDIVCDYLRRIWQYTKEDIRKRIEDNDWERNYTIHVVLTVPAMWSHMAKDKTLKAAMSAGLPKNIQLVTEPEAAALATLHDKAEDNTLRVGDAFVVCDAGGGTVGLISYKVNGLKPLKVEECAIGDGGLCGSVFLDIAFEKYIKTLVGEEQYRDLREIDKKKMMRIFENGVKRSFTVDSTKDYSVDLRGVKDNEEEGIVDETITLKQSMLRTIFDHVCGQIDNLVDNQIREVSSKGLHVKAILLVGGFGSSKFLHHRLEQSFSSANIAVVQVDGAWSAICRGACLWGLEHANELPRGTGGPPKNLSNLASTFIRRASRYSYGVSVAVPFDGSKHLWADRFFDHSNNMYMADNQMMWLLRRGEMVTEGRELSIKVITSVHGVGFTSTGSREFRKSLHYCQENDPPSRLDDTVKELCDVRFSVQEATIWLEKSFRSASMPGKFRNMTFELLVRLGNATLEYVVTYKDKPLGHVEAEYMQTF
ncbi:hypothetical protein NM208_g1479 [Fusarium decemcellulare]|uniref:Uncharacterized protein n=2 Tax=Fusarium decemcellulare TaxID=57161 RepID=A0ACC1RWJ1_9HYPO|nr:hypothetical protein NM208_g10936 [Fusarium decemcellulare]KAJ3547496.1 hypothetical protein NM208_g1479 [Fusarium decemcellulare]